MISNIVEGANAYLASKGIKGSFIVLSKTTPHSFGLEKRVWEFYYRTDDKPVLKHTYQQVYKPCRDDVDAVAEQKVTETLIMLIYDI